MLREYETSPPVALDRDQLALLTVPARRAAGGEADRRSRARSRCAHRPGSGRWRCPASTVRVLPKVEDLRNVLMMFGASARTRRLVSPHRCGYRRGRPGRGRRRPRCSAASARATRRGLVHGYRSTEERLPVLRGRLDVQQLASAPLGHLAHPLPLRRLHRGHRREPGAAGGRRHCLREGRRQHRDPPSVADAAPDASARSATRRCRSWRLDRCRLTPAQRALRAGPGARPARPRGRRPDPCARRPPGSHRSWST